MAYDYYPEWSRQPSAPGRRVMVATRPSWQQLGGLVIPSPGRRVVGAVSDYGWSWRINDYPGKPGGSPAPKAGDPVSINISGLVHDLLDGWPHNWAIALAVAEVDPYTIQPTSRKTIKRFSSALSGHKFAYDDVIAIDDLHVWGTEGSANFYIGTMPNNLISVGIELFACHQDMPEWDWSLWDISPYLPY